MAEKKNPHALPIQEKWIKLTAKEVEHILLSSNKRLSAILKKRYNSEAQTQQISWQRITKGCLTAILTVIAKIELRSAKICNGSVEAKRRYHSLFEAKGLCYGQ